MAKKILDSMTVDGSIQATEFTGSGAGLSNTTVPVVAINATGTANSSTYLRGDGTWSTVSGGGGGGYFVYTQIVASNTWNINHGLGIYPSVTVVDSGNNAVIGEIHYVDTNNITLTFTGSGFSGSAYLN